MGELYNTLDTLSRSYLIAPRHSGRTNYERIFDELNARFNRRPVIMPVITKVIFNDPATIVFWSDNTKTVVRCGDDYFDEEKGLAMAISKKALGNEGNYYETFKMFIDMEEL